MRYRPQYHFTASHGWINDPNGLVYYKGHYHLFFQHNPDSLVWDKMHWGHAISEDLVHWTELPIALYPDECYENDDRGGCFSGSAVIVGDRLFLFYTASSGGYQSQCIAYTDDGFNFHKYDNNPVIMPHSGIHDSRDPFIFKRGNKYDILLGFDGHIELYEADDLRFWSDEGTFFSFDKSTGTIAECPSIFEEDGKSYLSFSPISYGTEGHNVLFVEGTIENNIFCEQRRFAADYGPDYYALQTFADKRGKRVGIAWANGWQWMRDFKGFGPTEEEGWRGFLTFPRIFYVKDGHLCSYPIHEAEACYKELVIDEEITAGKTAVSLSDTDSFHLSLLLDPFSGDIPPMEIGIYKDKIRSLCMVVDYRSLRVFLYENSAKGEIERIFSAPILQGPLSIDIFADRASTEIYFNKGFSSFFFFLYRQDGFSGPWLRALSGEVRVKTKLFC